MVVSYKNSLQPYKAKGHLLPLSFYLYFDACIVIMEIFICNLGISETDLLLLSKWPLVLTYDFVRSIASQSKTSSFRINFHSASQGLLGSICHAGGGIVEKAK